MKLFHIEAKYYSTTIRTWRGTCRDKDFDPWLIAVFVDDSYVVEVGIFVDIGDRFYDVGICS